MKSSIRIAALTLALACLAFGARAQRLMIGEKAPEVKVAQWIGGSAPTGGKAQLIDFFTSSNDQCVRSLDRLNAVAAQYRGRINVLVISRETADKVAPLIEGKGYAFYFGLDDAGKTFTAYDVRFVPFCVLLDARGRVIWMGNVSQLTDATLGEALR